MVKNQKPEKQKDYNTVLLEELKHDFGIFGEGLTHIIGKVDRIDKTVERLKDDVEQVKVDIVFLREDMTEGRSLIQWYVL